VERLILASHSPRRRELLAQAGYTFEVIPAAPSAECGVCSGANPEQMVTRLARHKAADVAGRVASGLILGCDTVVECQGQILGKPADTQHARQMLRLLRGHEHRVLTGVCLWPKPGPAPLVRVAVTRLRMDPLDDDEIECYLASGQWEGKAGAFGYQDRLGWIQVLEGSESNVVGLPLELLAAMLTELRQ
jgi:septum formation protein